MTLQKKMLDTNTSHTAKVEGNKKMVNLDKYYVQCACAATVLTTSTCMQTPTIQRQTNIIHIKSVVDARSHQLCGIICHNCVYVCNLPAPLCNVLKFLAHDSTISTKTTKVPPAKAATLYYVMFVVMKIWSYRCIKLKRPSETAKEQCDCCCYHYY